MIAHNNLCARVCDLRSATILYHPSELDTSDCVDGHSFLGVSGIVQAALVSVELHRTARVGECLARHLVSPLSIFIQLYHQIECTVF